MAHTFKDKPARLVDWLRAPKSHRNCNRRGRKSCGYCMSNLKVNDLRIKVKAQTDEDYASFRMK